MADARRLSCAQFDFFAEEFDKTRIHPWEEAAEFIDSLSERSLVLDIGAGGGRHAIYAAKRHKVVAFDISRKMMRILIRKGVGIPCLVADAAHIPFEAGIFDAVLYVAAIHHIQSKKARVDSLREAYRVLRFGGKLIASAWSREQKAFGRLTEKSADILYTWNRKYPRFYHLFSKGEFLELAEGLGFRSMREWKSKDNWWFVAEK